MSEGSRRIDDEEKKKRIEQLRIKINGLSKIDKKDQIQVENLSGLHINLAYYLADFPECYDDSLNEFFKAQELMMLLDDSNKLASLKGAIASICYAKKDFMNAVEFYKESLDLLKKTNLNKEIMIGKKGLGLSLMGIDEEGKGISLLLEAADLCVDLSDTSNYMEIISILKIHYSKSGEWEMIMELEKKALGILENLENHEEIAYSLMEIGLCLSKLDRFNESLDFFKKSVNSALKSENNLIIYSGIILVAETYFHLKDIENAKKEYMKALSLISYIGNNDEIKKTSMVLLALGVEKKEIETEIEKGIREKKGPRRVKT